MNHDKQTLLAEKMGIVRDCLATSRTATAKLAQALAVIHDDELYLLTHATFEAFCAGEFDLSRSRGYQLLDFARVAETICTTIVDIWPSRNGKATPDCLLPCRPRSRSRLPGSCGRSLTPRDGQSQ